MNAKPLILAVRILLSASALAAEPNPHEAELLEAIHQTRMRQEEEENAVRVIQQPVTVVNDVACSPVEQARQRIRDLGAKDGTKIGDVTVEAGHGEVTVNDNHGDINNSVNVQINTPNENRKCF